MNALVWIIAISLVVTAAVVVVLAIRRVRRARVELPLALEARRADMRRRMVEILARTPLHSPLGSSEVPTHPRAALIEAKLLSGELRSALLAAEDMLLDEPSDPRVHVMLARVLIHCDEFGAASREIMRARRLGESGPMLDYLEARVEHLNLHRNTESRAGDRLQASPDDLVTPFEMFVLELERQRKRPRKARQLWLTVMSDTARAPQGADVMNFLTEHFSAYYDCLDKLMLAVEHEPAFTDALYHVARMALKVGLRDEGLALMEKIEPLMYASTEKRFYDRDLSRLRADAAPSLPTSAVLSAHERDMPSAHHSTRPRAVD